MQRPLRERDLNIPSATRVEETRSRVSKLEPCQQKVISALKNIIQESETNAFESSAVLKIHDLGCQDWILVREIRPRHSNFDPHLEACQNLVRNQTAFPCRGACILYILAYTYMHICIYMYICIYVYMYICIYV